MAGAETGARLGLALARLAARVREDSLARTTPALTSQVVRVAAAEAEARSKAAADALRGWLEEWASESPLPPAVVALLRTVARMGGFLFQQVLSTAIGFGVGGALSTVLEPYFASMAQAAWASNPVQTLSPSVLADLVTRGLVSPEVAAAEARRSGIAEERFAWIVEQARTRPAVGEILELRNRREITDDQALEHLQRLGYSPEDARLLLGLRVRVVPPTDVIRFAVREVFSPELRARLQLDADFPEDALPRFERAGISEADARDYWAAHWDLPSPTQGYEMLHRGLISEQELDDLLRALDYSPAWRDKLAAISYRVPTRVDLRRMYRAGVIDRDRVYRGYLDLGYAPDDARALTEFAVAEAVEEDRQPTASEVVTAYEARLIDQREAEEMLTALGYAPEARELKLALADARRERRFRELAISRVRSLFVGHRIDEAEAQTTLDRLGVPPSEKADLLEVWRLERAANVATLTASQVAGAARRGLLSPEEALERLQRLGYDRADAEIILGLAFPPPRGGGGGP